MAVKKTPIYPLRVRRISLNGQSSSLLTHVQKRTTPSLQFEISSGIGYVGDGICSVLSSPPEADGSSVAIEPGCFEAASSIFKSLSAVAEVSYKYIYICQLKLSRSITISIRKAWWQLLDC